jgi:hypothetical protein
MHTNNAHKLKGLRGAVRLAPTTACNQALLCTRACASTLKQATERSHACAHAPTTHARVRKAQCGLHPLLHEIRHSGAHARAPAHSCKQLSAHMHLNTREGLKGVVRLAPLLLVIRHSDKHTCVPAHSRKQPSIDMHTCMRQRHTLKGQNAVARLARIIACTCVR